MQVEVELIERIVMRVVAVYRPEAVGVFGSHAMGTATAKSDIDLVVIKSTREPMERRVAQVKRLLLGVMTRIDVVVLTPEEVASARHQQHTFFRTIVDQFKLIYVRPGLSPASLGLPDKGSGR